MKEFKRILLAEDADKLKQMVGHVNNLNPYLMDLKAKYEALDLGPFTNPIFQELIKQGTKNTENKYVEFLNKELNNVGVKSTLIRNNLTKESGKQFELLNESLKSLKSFKIPYHGMYEFHQLPLNLIIYNEGSKRFSIGDENNEIIKEQFCRLYIESFEEKRIYDSFTKIKEAYNEFLEITLDYPETAKTFGGLTGLTKYIKDAKSFIPFKSLQTPEELQKFQINKAEITDESLMLFIRHITANK